MRALAATLLLALLAGCLQPTAPGAGLAPASSSPAAGGVLLASWQGAVLTGASPHVSDAAGIFSCLATGDCPPTQAPCGTANCERRVVNVPVPPGFEGALVVGVRWPTDHAIDVALQVLDATGQVAAVGHSTLIDHLGSVAVVDRPTSGAYTVVVAVKTGKSSYQAAARLVPALPSAPTRELLPDLVTLPPTDLRIAVPTDEEVSYFGLVPGALTDPATSAAGAHGCAVDEFANGARRCLRFSNAVADVGEGPLDIALSLDQGATSPAGGHFVQLIHKSDGTVESRPAGPAQFHPIHAHWHNADANAFTVYKYDHATGQRGDAVAKGRKTGICFADVGLVSPANASALPAHDGVGCINPAARGGAWVMGLSPGWYDLYDWTVSDQYIDITGVPDGTYELCSVTNPEGTLKESDLANNEACAAFELRGNDVRTLSPEPYHKAVS
jgi:hypothetical protein